MFARRQLLAGSMLSAFSGDAVGGQNADARSIEEVARAVKDLRTALEGQYAFGDIAAVRQKQIEFFRAQAKFPDFIEVGLDVWFGVHDWHVRHLQPMTLGRDGAGRYTIMLLQTTLILRQDVGPSFISTPYDNR
jgi:hypothetical protein